MQLRWTPSQLIINVNSSAIWHIIDQLRREVGPATLPSYPGLVYVGMIQPIQIESETNEELTGAFPSASFD